MAARAPVTFHFDPVSPYAWLAGLQLGRLDEAGLDVDVRPVLFAGLLGKHGNLGPAEIPAKRRYIFRDVMREAAAMNTAMRGPPGHPFNPLRALRMCIAVDDAGARRGFALALMNAAWRDGQDITMPEVLAAIARQCGLDSAALGAQADDPAIKARLADATAAAAEAGIFGVPTFVFEGELFWGADRVDALLRRAAGARIDEAHLHTVLDRPAAATRKG